MLPPLFDLCAFPRKSLTHCTGPCSVLLSPLPAWQAGFRGMQARKGLAAEAAHIDEQTAAATKIQAQFKGHQVRKERKEEELAVTKIQASGAAPCAGWMVGAVRVECARACRLLAVCAREPPALHPGNHCTCACVTASPSTDTAMLARPTLNLIHPRTPPDALLVRGTVPCCPRF